MDEPQTIDMVRQAEGFYVQIWHTLMLLYFVPLVLTGKHFWEGPFIWANLKQQT